MSVTVTMTASATSSMAEVKKIVGQGEHIALSTQGDYFWKDLPLATASHLTLKFEEEWLHHNDELIDALTHIFPDLKDLELPQELLYQVDGNHRDAATNPQIHAHVVVSIASAFGKNGVVGRLVEDRRTRELIKAEAVQSFINRANAQNLISTDQVLDK